LTPGDLAFVAEMVGDAETMKFYPHRFTPLEARQWLQRQLDRYDRDGHGLWLVIERESGRRVGQVGLAMQDTGEQALEITEELVRSGAVDLIVIDSVAALVPRSEIEGDMGDATMGMQARLMSQALRKLSGAIKQTNTAVIFTNQLRQKIGVMFGNPETTSGGMALKFYASVRMDIRRVQSIKEGQEIVGNRARVRVVKNKVSAPFRTAEFDIMYNEGISRSGDLLDLATQLEFVTKRGSHYLYKEERLGQGRENAKAFLREHTDLAAEIEALVRANAQPMMNLGVGEGEPDV